MAEGEGPRREAGEDENAVRRGDAKGAGGHGEEAEVVVELHHAGDDVCNVAGRRRTGEGREEAGEEEGYGGEVQTEEEHGRERQGSACRPERLAFVGCQRCRNRGIVCRRHGSLGLPAGALHESGVRGLESSSLPNFSGTRTGQCDFDSIKLPHQMIGGVFFILLSPPTNK